jgi:hypothetical protein
MSSPHDYVFKSEVLALWYLRLNGVFTIPNFVLHPARRGSARTDADIAGVRYPFRAEFSDAPGLDDEWFETHSQKPCAILAEVKTGECKINGPWSSPEFGNIDQVLSDLGWYPEHEVSTAARMLYEAGQYDGRDLFCSLFCIGNLDGATVRERYPLVPQHTWSHIAEWIFERFHRYRHRKKDHSTWDSGGQARGAAAQTRAFRR